MRLGRILRHVLPVLTALLTVLLLVLLSSVQFVAFTPRRNSLFVNMKLQRRGDDEPPPVAWATASPVIHTAPPGPGVSCVLTNTSFSPGLGNLMFQYASLLGAAVATNRTVLLEESTFLRRAFALPSAYFVTRQTADQALRSWPRKKFPVCCRFSENVTAFLDETRENRAILGYFQSYRYFDNMGDSIRREFRFLPAVRERARDRIDQARAAFPVGATLIGVHVRHGSDLVLNSRNKFHGHTTANSAYYRAAMDHFRLRYGTVGFVVLGDDPLYAQRWLAANDSMVLAPSDREVDMCTLALCDHVLMSTGTFGWWAAFLAGGDVVYYSRWPLQNSKLDSMVHKPDFFPPNWLPMTG